MDKNIYNKLTDSAKNALEETSKEFVDMIIEKAYQNASFKNTADKEISLRDIIEAKEEILYKKTDLNKQDSRKKRLTLMLSMTGALYSVFGILFVLGLTGFMVAQTPFHEGLWERAENERLPLAGSLYKGLRQEMPEDLYQGVVLTLTEQGFHMQSIEEKILLVEINEHTRLPFGSEFTPGDMVMVIGELEDETIKAFGIRKINYSLPRPGFGNKPPPGILR